MHYLITHVTSYEYPETVAVCHNRVRLTPRKTNRQVCHRFQLEVDPVPNSVTRQSDYFGNLTDYFSIHGFDQKLKVASLSEVEVQPSLELWPEDSEPWESVRANIKSDLSSQGLRIFQLSLASSRVQLSEELREYTLQSFTNSRPITDAVQDLNRRIHEDFVFDQEATTVHTTIDEVFQLRRGVCQDFAHLAIGCLRSIGLAARYVSGYVRTTPPPGAPRLVGADASHAWLSVFCGKLGWVDLDPTNNLLSSDSHICVAWGRDYDDVCPIQGVFIGGGRHELHVSVDVIPWDELPLQNS